MLPVVIGGCPGSGKTSASKTLAGALQNSVLIETDHFFDYLTDPIDPSIPASKAQNVAVITAYAQAAKVYRDSGYHVIIEGVIGPWVFPILQPVLGRFVYILLRTSLACALERVALRDAQSVTPGKVERMHPQFEQVVPAYRTHVIDTEDIAIDLVSETIQEKIQAGRCEIKSL